MLYLYWKMFQKKGWDVYVHGYGFSGQYRLSYHKNTLDGHTDPHLSSRLKLKTVKSLSICVFFYKGWQTINETEEEQSTPVLSDHDHQDGGQ